MGTKVEDLLKDIQENLKHKNSSKEDEVAIMQAMVNDTSFVVGVYGKNGKEGEYCPAADFKKMASSIISSATKISREEASSIIADYDITKTEAEALVGISKQFINTYLETGRKLPLGCREETNFQLCRKVVNERVRPCPKKIGVNEEGKGIYEMVPTITPKHIGLKVYTAMPDMPEEEE